MSQNWHLSDVLKIHLGPIVSQTTNYTSRYDYLAMIHQAILDLKNVNELLNQSEVALLPLVADPGPG